jgi:hypothetical protein
MKLPMSDETALCPVEDDVPFSQKRWNCRSAASCFM